MIIGTVREKKESEYRVGLTPESVHELVSHGHDVWVETGAGLGIGAHDDAYLAVGARIAQTAAQVYETVDLMVKVKEPQTDEFALLRRGQVLFTYLHLAADKPQTEALMKTGAVCIAYETVTDHTGALPLLRPMSHVAGRLAVQAGATALEKEHGGRGVLLGGVPGVLPGKVVILGGGSVGFNAAQVAAGFGADVTIIDSSPTVLERLAIHFENRARTSVANKATIAAAVADADLVIGAVLVPGAATPRLVTRDMLKTMKPGSVLVDVAIDQGGCFESSRPTTHSSPTFIEDGVVHYCVSNMPGAVARTSAYALNNVTLPYVLKIAEHGWQSALGKDAGLLAGLNVCDGKLTSKVVADEHGLPFTDPAFAIS